MSRPAPSSNPMLYFATAIAAAGGVLFGFDFSVIGGAILYIEGRFHLGPGEVEVVMTATLIGATLFTPIAGWLADRFGRRPVLMICSGLGIVGAIGSGLAEGMVALFVARLISGATIGGIAVLAPLFISEVADTERRGKLVAFFGIGGVLGVVLAYGVDWLLAPGEHWRVMFVVAAVPAAVLMLGMMALPETPRWLVRRGRGEHARASLRRLRNSQDVDEELAALTGAVSPPGRWADLLKKGSLKSVISGSTLAFFRDCTGFSALVLYAPEIFAMAGFDAKGLRIFESLLVALVLMVGALAFTFLVDRFGRKPLLILGLVVMTVAMAALAASVALVPTIPAMGYVAVGAMMLWMLGFGGGPANAFFVLISEIYPQAIRARGMSLAVITRWACDVVVSVSFLTLVAWLGDTGTFALFAAIGLVGIMVCNALVHETRGQSLEQLEKTG